MIGFWIGLSIGLLLHRQSKKPLLRFPLQCWFLGHRVDASDMCERCSLLGGGRFDNTFWTN